MSLLSEIEEWAHRAKLSLRRSISFWKCVLIPSHIQATVGRVLPFEELIMNFSLFRGFPKEDDMQRKAQ